MGFLGSLRRDLKGGTKAYKKFRDQRNKWVEQQLAASGMDIPNVTTVDHGIRPVDLHLHRVWHLLGGQGIRFPERSLLQGGADLGAHRKWHDRQRSARHIAGNHPAAIGPGGDVVPPEVTKEFAWHRTTT